ncbi:MAG TPA: IMP dehydrogenase, partial [Nannocystaceae bacterium]|nr:IMP dehydrogenase [Nannocystaceae bacterium]
MADRSRGDESGPKGREDQFREALTFDDVLLEPGYSEVLPGEVNVESKLTRAISLPCPLVSAAMDTVTEADTAITMACAGGLGILHKNLSPEDQAREVRKVKKAQSWMVKDPLTVGPELPLSAALELMTKHGFSGLPVVDHAQLIGILTSRDVRFETALDRPVRDLMTRDPITAAQGISADEAKRVLHKHRIEKLLVVDADKRLVGLITVKDILKAETQPEAVKDAQGRLRVGAAVGTSAETMERVAALVEQGVDLIVVDTAHGDSKRVSETVRAIRREYKDLQLVAGNIATPAAVQALIDAGADGIKLGIGPGSICTTRVVAGVGVPQISAIFECAPIAKKAGVPLVADGGVKYSGDVVKAIAAGASTVMIGSLFAGTDEAPGELVLYQGRTYKVYRGMGSIGAMRAGSKDRYFQGGTDDRKLVPEGIEG